MSYCKVRRPHTRTRSSDKLTSWFWVCIITPHLFTLSGKKGFTMTTWAATMDFGVVHALVYPECRTGAGPVLETLQTIVDDPYFGAVEIAPIKDPAVRAQARALLAAAQLQVVYLPILPMLLEDLGLGSADADLRQAAHARMH